MIRFLIDCAGLPVMLILPGRPSPGTITLPESAHIRGYDYGPQGETPGEFA